MNVKPGKQILIRGDDRIVVHAALFLICAVLSAAGLVALALWCFLPSALLIEMLSGAGSRDQHRRM